MRGRDPGQAVRVPPVSPEASASFQPLLWGAASLAGFSGPETITRPGLQLVLWRGWLAPEPARLLRAHLEEAIRWQQTEVRVYGRLHPVPRLVAWHGDPGCTYRYSGQCHQPEPWTPPLQDLRAALQEQLGCAFNSLLLNRYRSGADRMGWHADDEPELEPREPIASLSLGASRTLRFRPKPWPRRSGPPGPAAASSEPPARQKVAGALLDSADALHLPAVRSPGRIPDRRLAGRADTPADLLGVDRPWLTVANAGAPGPAAAEPPSDGRRLSPFNLELHDGDLLLMAFPSQQHWQHGLPARLRQRQERFNLTFRRIRPL